MKNDMLKLIVQIDEIKSHFHLSKGKGAPALNTIYNDQAFAVWKEKLHFELIDVYDRTKDEYIQHVLENLQRGFDGWSDEKSFHELAESLLVIKKNINKYYP